MKKNKKNDMGFGIGVPVPMNPEEFKELVENIKGKKQPTINEHYGVSDEQYNTWMKEILCDMIMNNDMTKVIDKHFPNLNADDRVKMVTFSEAMSHFLELNKCGCFD